MLYEVITKQIPMTLEAFRDKLTNNPTGIEFTETMEVIDALYNFTPTEFKSYNFV